MTNVGEFDWFWAEFDKFLSQKQLKQTQQRKLIIDYFLQANRHIDADELHEIVKGKGHNIGLATIYRTLNLLKDSGLVEQRTFAEGRSVFEVSNPNSHHDHLICQDCGKIFEFENEKIEEIQLKIAEQLNFSLTDHRLELFGKCQRKDCTYRNKV
ncbi:MAG: transcriptional repressor [Bdellovibrionota bacterium]